MSGGLRLMIYDRTCGYLTTTWVLGAWLYRRLGRLDAHFGASTWEEALEWLASYEPEQPIAEIQYWGHGNWGALLMDRVRLDVDAFTPDHPLHFRLARIRDRLLPASRSLVWFRTCETFGTEVGHRFARTCADFFGAKVAGHTYVIAWAQSGLHTLRPGESPEWSIDEGLGPDPKRARWSGFFSPNTISCLHGTIPDEY
jgi:hypothetical protein